MPPPLALLLCTLFRTLTSCRYDRRQARGNTWALWLPTLWTFLIATKPLGIWFGVGGTDIDAGSPPDRTFLSALLVIGLIILLNRGFNWSAAIRENRWLMLLLCYMLVSVIWSDTPYNSFKRSVRELTAVVMAFVVYTEPWPKEALQSLLRRSVYVLIPFSLLVIKYFPNYGVQYVSWSGERMWVGVTTQKNALGRLCMIAALFLVWTLMRRWKKRDIPVAKYQTSAELLLLGLTAYIFKGPPGAYPATALVALIVGVTAFVALLWMKKHNVRLSARMVTVCLTAVIAFGVITPLVGGSTVADFTLGIGRDATLTGRTDIWAGLLPFCSFGRHFWGAVLVRSGLQKSLRNIRSAKPTMDTSRYCYTSEGLACC